jgi:hypothetical protein
MMRVRQGQRSTCNTLKAHRQAAAGVQDGSHDCRAAVDVELHHVLARERVRFREQEDKRVVQSLAPG